MNQWQYRSYEANGSFLAVTFVRLYTCYLSFRPNKVIAVFNITTDQSTRPKILLQLIVDSLRKGEVKTFDEPVSGKLTLDVRGFRFLNNRGVNFDFI